MARNAFLLTALLGGLAACGGSNNKGLGDAGDGGDGGGGPSLNGPCTAPDYTQGTCIWPEYCLGSKCVPPQNLSDEGVDVPASACITSSATPQGGGNLDSDRDDGGADLVVPDSAIITDMLQIPIQSDSDCASYLGQNATEFEEAANECLGGNPDKNQIAICAAMEAVALFSGHAFDPKGNFSSTEGGKLDGQFYYLLGSQAPTALSTQPDAITGAAQSGFIIPGTGWTASGGPFVLAQCLVKSNYPLLVNSDPIILHFADTAAAGEASDAGLPGNSYCAKWTP